MAFPLTILVCGGRDYADASRLCSVLDLVHGSTPIACLVHGGARGTDRLASQWAATRAIPTRCFPAQWQKHGRAAGALRNQQMLDEGRPDLVVAFPGRAGTADMMTRAYRAGTPILRVPWADGSPLLWPGRPALPGSDGTRSAALH